MRILPLVPINIYMATLPQVAVVKTGTEVDNRFRNSTTFQITGHAKMTRWNYLKICWALHLVAMLNIEHAGLHVRTSEELNREI